MNQHRTIWMSALASLVTVSVGCFDGVAPPAVALVCATGADCPDDLLCLDVTGRCVVPQSLCIAVSGREASALVDGTACGDGSICVQAACVTPRCGDGLVTEGEACDDGAANSDVDVNACRTDCARAGCGDGVTDSGEACDDGNADSGDGCRDDCQKVEACGDRIVDDSETCDDGNGNPRDGCAFCQTQTWSRALTVSGRAEGALATEVALGPSRMAVDGLGRVYLTDRDRVLRLNDDGTFTNVAGSAVGGFSGDGGQATSAQLDLPADVAVDASGRIFIADTLNNRIRRVDVDGIITTVAGSGVRGFSGDGGPATVAQLNLPSSVTVDASGRIFVADTLNNRIRQVDLNGAITTVAGTGVRGFGGDGGPATSAQFGAPSDIAVDTVGRLFFRDAANRRIRVVDVDGTIRTVASDTADGASTNFAGVAVDANGRVFLADSGNNRIRRVEGDGTIITVAGTGEAGFSGDGGPAISAAFNAPSSVAFDGGGRLFVRDSVNNRVRRIDVDGTIRTVAGSGEGAFDGDGGPATRAPLLPSGVALDANNQLFIAEINGHRVRRVDADGTITTVAGTAASGFGGDGGPATNALFFNPRGVAVDARGRIFVADRGNNRIRLINLDGTITTVAGNGERGFRGDGGAATSAELNGPEAVAVDARGRLFIADVSNHRIRLVDVDGTITTVAGTGVLGFSGDGGPATIAGLNGPAGVAVDASGRIFVADSGNHRIRLVEVDGTITTVAGTGEAGFSGEGGPATGAQTSNPVGVAVDTSGHVFLIEMLGGRVSRFEVGGNLTRVAGGGVVGGDGGPATGALLGDNLLSGIAVDASGRLFITHRASVRRIDVDGTITTIAGVVHPAGQGPFARAQLYPSRALVHVDDTRLLSVGDFGRAMVIDLDTEEVVVAVGYASPGVSPLAAFTPLLADARGVVVDPVTDTLIITEAGTGALRIIAGVSNPASTWTATAIDTDLVGPAGIAYDDISNTFVVAEEANHCVRRIDRGGTVVDTVFGTCGARGRFPGFLDGPTHVAISPITGAVYVADTNNNRVLRINGGEADLVIGDGSVSSAGEGAPARLFPVNAPRQLATDAFGNLYIASSTTVRLVANTDDDDDADGDDRVFTIFGGGARDAFPESDTFCLNALSVGGDGVVHATDACQGFLVSVTPDVAP